MSVKTNMITPTIVFTTMKSVVDKRKIFNRKYFLSACLSATTKSNQ